MPSFSAMQRSPLLLKAPLSDKGSGTGGHLDRRKLDRMKSSRNDELIVFRFFLSYLCADLTCCPLPISNVIPAWIAFSVVAVVVPVTSCVLFGHLRPYDLAFQIPLTVASGLAFNSLNTLCRKYGLRRSLFLDQLREDSKKVKDGYQQLFGKTVNTFGYWLLLPVTTVDGIYKAYWYFCTVRDPSTAAQIPPSLIKPWMASIMFTAELFSFMYRVALIFLDCVLFKLNCGLQVLRMEDFIKEFHQEADIINSLKHHIKLRKQLRIISHRHRFFIITFLITATASQFWTILLTTRPRAQFNLFVGGELILGGACLVGGILMCLGSAACITHKAQALTSHAATWHACATINPCDPSMAADVEAAAAALPPATPTGFNNGSTETITVTLPVASSSSSSSSASSSSSPPAFVPRPVPTLAPIGTVRFAPEVTIFPPEDSAPDASSRSLGSNSSSSSIRRDMDGNSDDEDEWARDMDRLLITHTTISYQKRQAIVTYLENNKGGITIYGFVVDRTWLHALFMIEFSLVMWLLGKTVGI